MPIQHLTSSVIMVRPIDFGYNSQTGIDNEFQHPPLNMDQLQVQKQAIAEFDACIKTLNEIKVETLILEKTHTQNLLPDAVFPNNWFSTRHDGKLIVYPMKTPNRQDEVQIAPLEGLLVSHQYKVNSVLDYRNTLEQHEVLEGTGSLIFHHPSQHLFAAISERCNLSALNKFNEEFGYQLTHFKTKSSSGSPIYHTNVLMSCGEDLAVLTRDIIEKNDANKVIQSLENCISDIIVIDEQQMTENFCGNILQLKDKNNEPVVAMSKSAYQGFKTGQRRILEKHGSLAVCDIETIEYIGGGSVRCMLAENFLPTC